MVTGREDDGALEPELEELALASDDDGLPWLDSEDEEEESGVDPSRVALFALLAVAALAIILGGVYWLTRDGGDPELVADGSTIEAPAGPIKEKPEDPGGASFQGTADTSAAVAEGETREGRLAEGDSPRPSIDLGKAEQAAPASSGVGVQVGAYSRREHAEEGWNELVRRYEVLSGVSHRVVEGQADIGKVYRLQAVASDRASAERLCASIRSAGGACQVK